MPSGIFSVTSVTKKCARQKNKLRYRGAQRPALFRLANDSVSGGARCPQRADLRAYGSKPDEDIGFHHSVVSFSEAKRTSTECAPGTCHFNLSIVLDSYVPDEPDAVLPEEPELPLTLELPAELE